MRKLIALFLVLALMASTLTAYAKPKDKLGKKRAKPTIVLKGKILSVSRRFIRMKVLKANRHGRKYIKKSVVIKLIKKIKIRGKGKRHVTELVKGDYIMAKCKSRRRARSLKALKIVILKDKKGVRKRFKFTGTIKKVDGKNLVLRVEKANRLAKGFIGKNISFSILKNTKILVTDEKADIDVVKVGEKALVLSKAAKTAKFFGAYLINIIE